MRVGASFRTSRAEAYERDYVTIIPASPLAPGARYRVRLELIVAANDVVDEWEFETER